MGTVVSQLSFTFLLFTPINKSEASERPRGIEKEGSEKDRRFGTVNFERRSHPRYSLNLLVEYWQTVDSKSHLGRTGSISEGGILLYLPEEVEIGKNLSLRLFIDSGLTFLSIAALVEVVWKSLPCGNSEEHRIGVKLIAISEKDMANLKTFLNSLMDLKNNPKLDIPPRLLSAFGFKTPDSSLKFPK